MKETKVYVDDKLLIYDDFSLCCTKNFDNTFYTNNYSLIDNEEYFEAYFQSIKTHDRELVKEVCEKIRTMAHKVGKLVFCEHCYKTNSARAIDEHLLNEILGQIESEFEQKEYEK